MRLLVGEATDSPTVTPPAIAAPSRNSGNDICDSLRPRLRTAALTPDTVAMRAT